MAESKLERFTRLIPSLYKPGVNTNVTALLKAWAQELDIVVDQIENTKSQLFVTTAEGQYLSRLASSLGVTKPDSLGLTDAKFQELIPNLSLKPKQIKKTIYDTLDVFWGPLYSRSNVTSTNFAPFNISQGDTIELSINNGITQTIVASAGEIETPGAATSEEVTNILNRANGITASIITDNSTGNEFINIRTNTTGAFGSVNIIGGSMIGSGELNFTAKKYLITDLPERTVLYQIQSKELIIEIPVNTPILQRALLGSHHFHADSSLAGPVAPANGVWVGSFLYDPKGSQFTITSKTCTLNENILSGQVIQTLQVTGATGFPSGPGYLIFDFGLDAQEQPIKYNSVPNSNTILIDPTHVFTKEHLIDAKINVLSSLAGYVPRTNGADYAIYTVSETQARLTIEEILKLLVAAGVVVRFNVLLPTYEYLVENPYVG